MQSLKLALLAATALTAATPAQAFNLLNCAQLPVSSRIGHPRISISADTTHPNAPYRVVFVGLNASVNHYAVADGAIGYALWAADPFHGGFQYAGRLKVISTLTAPPTYSVTYEPANGPALQYGQCQAQ